MNNSLRALTLLIIGLPIFAAERGEVSCETPTPSNWHELTLNDLGRMPAEELETYLQNLRPFSRQELAEMERIGMERLGMERLGLAGQ